MKFEILENGAVIDTIVATQEFMTAFYPRGNYREIAEVAPAAEAPIARRDAEQLPLQISNEPETKQYDSYIDIGPFFDRFEEAKVHILTSQDPAVRAILDDIRVRPWVDLSRPEVKRSLAYVGSVVTSLTPALQEKVISVAVTEQENFLLRKMYFS
jgi:hypothetical protein